MTKRVLVPVDGSPQSDAALEFVADEWDDADVVLLTVVDPAEAGFRKAAIATSGEEWYERAKVRAEEIFEQARERLGRDVPGEVEVGRPSKVIVEFAEETDADHLVVGSHGREGVSRVLLGSVAESVVRRSPVPVTVVRGYESDDSE